jgi:hypothetical protein
LTLTSVPLFIQPESTVAATTTLAKRKTDI